MKKILLAVAALLVSAFAVNAAGIEYAYTLVVNKTDGTKIEYKFAEMPVVQTQGDDIKITLGMTQQSVLYPMADVNNFTFDRETNGINDVIGDETRVSFGLTANTLEAAGLAPGTIVAVYNASGSMVARGTCDADGVASISIASLAKGVYVVSAGSNSFKFIR